MCDVVRAVMRKFMRTRAAHQHHQAPVHHNGHPFAHKTNGHANGVGLSPAQDHHSTVSRYWSASGESSTSGGGGPRPPWVDPNFPASASSLGTSRGYSDVLWMRPTELCSRPRFRGDSDEGAEGEPEEEEGGTRWAVEASALTDGGVAVAAAALAPTPRLLDRVVPRGQTFAGLRYTGAFRFRFWVFGVWREVIVDDRLPTRAGRLLSVHSARADDFTLPLLEKAYAKLYGSYAALHGGGGGGGASRALQDLSGGIVQSFSLRHQGRALTLQVLNSALPRSTLVVATVPADEAGRRRSKHGLLPVQPYCVSGLARVRPPTAGPATAAADVEAALVRLRSVSGRGEWTGPWARGSAQWRALPEADREALAARAPHPGHFWMSFGDFAAAFGRLELVHVGPDDWLAEASLHGRRPWRAVLARRRWRCGHNAGGPPRAPTAHANPHFHVGVPRSETGGARPCHVVVSVTQQYEPLAPRRPLHAIGLAVYELGAGAGDARGPLRPLDVTHECRAREVATFFTLPAGQYLVVPHTARAHTEAAFLLRILTDDHTDVWEVNEDNVIVRDVMAEFLADGHSIPVEVRRGVAKLLRKNGVVEVQSEGEAETEGGAGAEVETALVRRALRAGGVRGVRVSREVSRALVALRDPQARGAVTARDVPALVALLAFWAAAFRKYGGGGGGAAWGAPACSSYRLRALLWAAGLTASNKVLECLVLRFADGASISATNFVLALARLHLAHERYRSLEAKMKSNPLSLEEMILMTIYS